VAIEEPLSEQNRTDLEMPGLRVTLAQACRLWQLDAATCEELLDHLFRDGFIRKTASGSTLPFRTPANATEPS
jgi:hypothetical protein